MRHDDEDILQALADENDADAAFFEQREAEDKLTPLLFPMPELDDIMSKLGFMEGGSLDRLLITASDPVETEHHPNLDLTEYRTTFKINHNMPNDKTQLLVMAEHIDSQFEAVFRPLVDRAAENDKITMRISHPALTEGDMYLYRFKRQFGTVALTNQIAALVQSNAEFIANGRFNLSVGIVKNTSGGARTAAAQTVHDNRTASTSLIQIVNDGVDCGHIAIYLAEFRLRSDWRGADSKESKRLSKSVSSGTPTYIRRLSSDRITIINGKLSALSNQLGRDISLKDLLSVSPNAIVGDQTFRSTSLSLSPDEELNFTGLEVYAWFLNIQIIVFGVSENKSRSGASLLFKTNINKPPESCIFLELLKKSTGGNHYNVIPKISGYLGGRSGRQFCYVCYSSVDKLKNHFCKHGCDGCNSDNVCFREEDVSCPTCHRKCRSLTCLQQHQERKNCDGKERCPACRVTFLEKQKASHRCLQYDCKKCGEKYFETPHYCYMRPLPINEDKEEHNIVVVAFDIESKFVNLLGKVYHEPDLLCALITCNECYVPENVMTQSADGTFRPLKEADCSVCLKYRKEFIGRGCVKRFADYVYGELSRHVAKKNKDTVIRVFAHNFKGYDGRFVLRDLFNRHFEKPSLIMQGSKISSMEVANIRFQDSLNIFQCALSKLPKSFGFDARVLKGKFPYLFNTPANAGYKGPTPALSFYGYDDMKPDEQAALRAYHATVADRMDFDLEKEKLEYCRDDVEILMIAVQRFRETFKQITGFDPVRPYFTLPSMSFGGFRRQFLKANTIGITPTEGYGRHRKSSDEGHSYLDLVEIQIGRRIRREQKFGYVFADGFDPETHTVYEFYGCRWHGCLRCKPYERDRKQPRMDMTLNEAYAMTQEKSEYYQHLKSIYPLLKIVEKWECELNSELRLNSQMKRYYNSRLKYYKNLKQIGGCDLRESYFGGRTNNRKFFHVCETEDEWFEYVDFTSLYPAVCAKFPYMKGHPIVIRSNFEDLVSATNFKKEVFGFVKCKVYPPTNLQFPILPARIHDRLEFVLCMTCAQAKTRTTCFHTNEERSLVGTFATPELQEALDYGYRIAEVYEILHWEEKDCDMFKPFVFQWLKIKQESSGYPSWVQTEDDKVKYIDDYEQRQGIRLNPACIKRDDIKREMAKRQLNSFYGKFAQRANMEQSEIVETKDKLWNLLSDPRVEVTGHVTVSENTILMNHRKVNDEDARQGVVNVAIASFITSYARRELWRAINKIETQEPGCVYYFDTDSIIYKARTGMELLPTGDLLGDLTSEVGRGERIIQLVCLGPKNYAYVVRQPDGTLKTIIKVKGITLNAKALDILTVQKLTEIAKQYCLNPDEEQLEISIHQTRIGADPKHQIVMQQEMWKVYRAVSEKRVVIGNDTLPYGWVALTENQNDCIDTFISFLNQ